MFPILMLPFLPFLIIGVILAIVVVGMVVSYYQEKRRTEALAGVAGELGLMFAETDTVGVAATLGSFPLFSQGRSRQVANVIHGETEQVRVAIFDYRYTTGSGKSSHTWRQTVVRFQSPALSLPGFVMRPEQLFDKLGAVVGYDDIDFETHPQFSKRYLLRGSPEPAVRAVFRSEVLNFFEQVTGQLNVEAAGPQLIVYRAHYRFKPDEIRGLMELGFRVFGLLKSPAANA